MVVVNDGVPLSGDRVNPVHSGTWLVPEVGVAVGPLVGEGVGVSAGPVGDGVGVLGVMANTSWQEFVPDALGVAWGTVGATDCWVWSLVEVKYATTPMTTVRTVTNSKYQYFFKKFIG